jgi:hypothetical protein
MKSRRMRSPRQMKIEKVGSWRCQREGGEGGGGDRLTIQMSCPNLSLLVHSEIAQRSKTRPTPTLNDSKWKLDVSPG